MVQLEFVNASNLGNFRLSFSFQSWVNFSFLSRYFGLRDFEELWRRRFCSLNSGEVMSLSRENPRERRGLNSFKTISFSSQWRFRYRRKMTGRSSIPLSFPSDVWLAWSNDSIFAVNGPEVSGLAWESQADGMSLNVKTQSCTPILFQFVSLLKGDLLDVVMLLDFGMALICDRWFFSFGLFGQSFV